MNDQITDTAKSDRQSAIAEAGIQPGKMDRMRTPEEIAELNAMAGAIGIPFHCAECGHDWQSATSSDCPVCAERSPFDRVENAFQNWWQKQGRFLSSGTIGDKAAARCAWMGGATAGIDSVRRAL